MKVILEGFVSGKIDKILGKEIIGYEKFKI